MAWSDELYVGCRVSHPDIWMHTDRIFTGEIKSLFPGNTAGEVFVKWDRKWGKILGDVVYKHNLIVLDDQTKPEE